MSIQVSASFKASKQQYSSRRHHKEIDYNATLTVFTNIVTAEVLFDMEATALFMRSIEKRMCSTDQLLSIATFSCCHLTL